ncbi:mandelate racemase/muconate lactonizing enzyme family protein [Cupriavidus taiwanensis]|uniref:Mandelate racemase or muconate lactonizing enzyme n=1 Tax=Cupriavidus taiwanensis TaxID=164546 RepID=A0A7Z7NM54_9BURK|nr:mandelate racemase/muconate lactonizing enzyme family protein [Cupriavidus taiwanensis]SOY87770.1 Mandelate racemase or muconate lactonizing enzyme [Cupriavidus taiwanensis]SOZ05595.1 Mandelate racemase or muconate lactonizing enzyme [Cupriavidus taiwanensis]SOZ07579.1 Mandelate racemase or muconate lactonizing enzyme [Cupriavidus taiwanensis]SPC15617.1 Mandelate racemase or muconate lactonizing enzyme [Cupriavidus taiwanensis]SPD40268.1 Mandelate racemase or muconate lactonizing enzyme [Cu
MKIASIEAIVLRIPFTVGGVSAAGVWGGAGMQAADSLLLKVSTDDGLVGWGETFGFVGIPAVKAAIEQMLAPACIGRDASQIEAIGLDLQRRFHVFGRSGPLFYGLSALDIALWDLCGKAAGLPVHRLLGGAWREQLPAYASLIRYADAETIAVNVRRAIADGYRSLKLHEVDLAVIRAARAAAGPDIEITLDTNCPWTLPEAIDMARALQPLSLRWLEEPLWPPENYAGLAALCRRCAIPLAAGENATTLMEFEHLLGMGAVDVVQPSPAKMGGISALRDVFALARAHNTQVMVHTFYDGPGLLAAMHATAALGDTAAMIEWRYFDMAAQVLGDAVVPRGGMIALPAGPGLGIDPDPEVIRRYRVG